MFLLFYEYHSGLLSLFTGVDMDGDELFSTLQYSLILFFKKAHTAIVVCTIQYKNHYHDYCYLLVGTYTIVYTPN